MRASKLLVVASVALLALLAQAALAAPAVPAPLQAQLDAIAAQHLAVRGAAVVLVDRSGVQGAWFSGTDERACFRGGSVSKLFTALLAQRLAERGAIDLDAPLPADLQPPRPLNCGTALTTAMLLEHTGGVVGSSHADYGRQWPDAPVAAVARETVARPLAWCPGLHYAYSNDGVTLAAAALERAGGADFDALMQREVFSPLGLARASFATATLPPCVRSSHDGDGAPIDAPWQLPVRPAGALLATPLELAAVVRMALRGGDGFLQRASLDRMAHGRTGLAARSGAGEGAYGLGQFRWAAAGRLWRGHWGRIDGFQTALGFDPGLGRGFVVMTDTADRRAMHALREATAAHVAQGAVMPAAPPPVAPAPFVPGWYANASHDMPLRAPWVELWDVVRVRAQPDGVRVDTPWWPGSERHLIGVTPTSFRSANADVAHAAAADGPWWIDGESYARVTPAWALGRVAVVAVGVVVTIAVLLHAPWSWLRRQRAAAGDVPLRVAACAFAVLGAGYAAWGLLGSGAALASLGRPSGRSLLLLAASVIAPLAAAAAAWHAAQARDGRRVAAALALLALGALCAANGWVPLRTWQS
jgi:CubicO group peptidase (beta-lactamase class C family)